ncbi:hypothetical protein [Streptomyces sp. CoH17]|uniref:hypothetical protein n=1 Tax=Streptomyces sp. CoH17 TaxID=2992806 RepID=UPI00227111F4|nr:hypothetical protein [Streptomyces sp. CoH17]
MKSAKCLTVNGPGTITDVSTLRGRDSYYVEGSGFSGWYSDTEIQITANICTVCGKGTILPYDPRPSHVNPGFSSTIEPNEAHGVSISLQPTCSNCNAKFNLNDTTVVPHSGIPAQSTQASTAELDAELFGQNGPDGASWDDDKGLRSDDPRTGIDLDTPFIPTPLDGGVAPNSNRVSNVELGLDYMEVPQIKLCSVHRVSCTWCGCEDYANSHATDENGKPVEPHDMTNHFHGPHEDGKTGGVDLDEEDWGPHLGAVEDEVPEEWKQYLALLETDSMVRQAAWAQVRTKAVRLRTEGHVHVEEFDPREILAQVRGDHGTYQVKVSRKHEHENMQHKVSGWTCSCPWGKWAWKRKRKYVGRMCSHAYATYMQMQSLEHSQKKEALEDPTWHGYNHDFYEGPVGQGPGQNKENPNEGDPYPLQYTPTTNDAGGNFTYTCPGCAKSGSMSDLVAPNSSVSTCPQCGYRGPNTSFQPWKTSQEQFAQNVMDTYEHLENGGTLQGLPAMPSALGTVDAGDEDGDGESDLEAMSTEGSLQEGLDWLRTGGNEDEDDRLEAAVTAFLDKTAGKHYTPAEQRALVDEEGEAVHVSQLNLTNSHYLA